VTVSSITVSSAKAMVVQASVSPSAVAGSRNVTVTTGAEVVTSNNGFAVGAGLPAITSISPNTGKQGEVVSVTVSGQFTHFAPGLTQVALGGGVTAGSIVVADETSLTAQLTIAAAATVGSRTLTITTGSEIATLNNAFTVTAGTPALAAITPNAAKQGETVTVAITGEYTHFAQGVTQADFGAGVVLTGLTSGSATSLTAQLSIGTSAAPGLRNVTVTSGTEVVTLNNSFSVLPGTPAILSVAPNSAQQGQNIAVTILPLPAFER
jgi:hypothetical protein